MNSWYKTQSYVVLGWFVQRMQEWDLCLCGF